MRIVRSLLALCVTAFWAGMLYFGGNAMGIPIKPEWLLALSAVIFLIVLLGLSAPAIGADDASEEHQASPLPRQYARPVLLAHAIRRPAASTPAHGHHVRLGVEQNERPNV